MTAEKGEPQMKKGLVLSTIPAPYRVNVFSEMSRHLKLDIYFEKKQDESYNKDFFCEKSFFRILTEKTGHAAYKESVRNLKQYAYVLVYEYSTITAMKLMQLCIRNRIPYFINCDGAFINHNLLKYMVKHYFISNATGCLANGTHAKEYFLHYGAREENIFQHHFSTLYEKDILQTCVTPEEKAALKEKLGLENRKTVIAVGRFIHSKGFDVLLKAWEKMPKAVNLIILGGGEKEDEYRQFIEMHHLANVTLLGFKPCKEVLRYFKACDLFVLPTRKDVWGLVINEAMACGLPVITTDRCIAGMELITNGENGYIVPVEDVDALTEKMKYILENDTLAAAMGRASLERIRPYTIENIAKSHIFALQQKLGE